MDLKAFAALVADMRHEQKEFFRTKNFSQLNVCKRKEKEVDDALQEIANPQHDLFSDQS